MTGTILGIAMISMSVLFWTISIPLLKGMIRMNKFYGFRIKKAFQSDELWYKINVYGARQFIYGSVFLFVTGLLLIAIPGLMNINLSDLFLLIFYLTVTAVIISVPVIRTVIYSNKL